MSGCNSCKFIFSKFLSEKTTFNWTNWWPLLNLFHLAELSNERRNQIRRENVFFIGVRGIGRFKMEHGNLKVKTHSLSSTWSGFGSLYPCVTRATTFPSVHPSYGIPPAKKWTNCGRDTPEYFVKKCWDLNQRDPLLVLGRSIRNVMFPSLMFYVIDYHFSVK